MRYLYLLLATLLLSNSTIAQPYSITGKIEDGNDTLGLVGVNVQLINSFDTTQKTGALTDENGGFVIENLNNGTYKLRASYVGFNNLERNITVADNNVALGSIKLQVGANTLENVVVAGKAVRAQQLGDTTQFNANAYKTNPDANAEDLVTKMPGVTSENGTLKVNGEEVKRILVDGKPFFGDDPNAATKNLPAEVIDKIQVFDRLSDQSQFTGFDDGSGEKTINIITKPGKNNGQFGKVYGGYGTDERYSAGGNINFFNGDRKVSVLGLVNNINQQNFSSDDLLGVASASSGSNRGGGGPPRGGGGNFNRGGGRPQGGGGSNAGNFLVGNQGGITKTNALGLNYSDMWGKKIQVSGSYFFNQTDNENNSDVNRLYTTSSEGLTYKENSRRISDNINHRANLRLEYTIDSSNSIIATPRISFQDNKSYSTLAGSSSFGDGSLASLLNTNINSNNAGYNFSNDLLYRHKFGKRGRTLSLNIGTQVNERNGDGKFYSLQDTFVRDQEYNQYSNGYTLSSTVTYTEPITQKSQLMVNYSPSYTSSKINKETYDVNGATGDYTNFNDTLSNQYDNTYTRQKGGISYRINDQKYTFNVGVDAQYAELAGTQFFPYSFDLQKSFTGILPQAMFNYKFSKSKNLRIMYRTSTNAPSITQLQSVADITNSLLIKTGNPDLAQDYQHTLTLRYGNTNTTTARSFFAFLYSNFANNYIGNATYIPAADTVFEGIRVESGSQVSRPTNLDGYFNTRGFLTYGMPVEAIKSNLNLNLGASYTHTPTLINYKTNFNNTYNVNAGFTLGSNINENIDFALTYSGNYNIAKNTLQGQLDNRYFSQNTALKFNWIFLKGFVFNTNVTHTLYTGVSEAFNQNFLLWNASFGYKFLKDRSLEAKIVAYDILNQNQSVSGTSTETYIEDSRTDVLQQYFMLQVTYTLRNFKK